MKNHLFHLFESKKHVYILFLLISLLIICTNAKWGYGLLGNDNFSPELDPGLTLQRSFENPGWRTYRALGVPSDSEQADTVRALFFYILSLARIPYWALSQIYLFGTLIVALLSAGKLTALITKDTEESSDEVKESLSMLFGGLFYISSLLTVWIYYFPVQLFVAGYAFLPLVAWRLLVFAHKATIQNAFFLAVSAVLIGVSGLTATMFLVICAVLICFGGTALLDKRFSLRSMCIGLGLIFLLNAYWLVPFGLYVHSNTSALQDSLINRKITTLQVQNEQKYTVLPRTLRYAFSWLDDRLSTGAYAYTYRGWYMNLAMQILGYLPIAMAVAGAYYLVKKRKKWGGIFIFLALAGIFLIKGSNPPFGFLYTFLQDASSIFKQVFRWRSSKFWPLLAISLPILATYGAVELSKKRPIARIALVILLLITIFPMLTGSLVRPSMYTKVPSEYFSLADYLKKQNSQARMYAAPEANTLYFRNYQWGFFGSVILNYILPNPTFEKALVIGSSESEQAFYLLKNAYYSGDTERFNKTLALFKVAYILDDRSVIKGESGYDYNLALNDAMIRDNPGMTREWTEGKLSLYKLLPVRQFTSSPVHQFTSSPVHQFTSSPVHQFTSYSSPHGSIYPFLLKPTSAKYTKEGVQVGYTIPFDGSYTFSFPEKSIQEAPAHIVQNPKGIDISPGLPVVAVDGQSINPTLPQKSMAFKSTDGEKFTFDDSLLQMPMTLPIRFAEVHKDISIRGWEKSETIDLLTSRSSIKLFCNNIPLQTALKISDKNTVCGSDKMSVLQDALLHASLEISSSEPIQLSWCFSSENKRECIQSQRFYTIVGKQKISLDLPKVLQAGDTMQMFMNFSPLGTGKASDVKIHNLTWDTYEGRTIDYTYSEVPYIPETRKISLRGTYPVSMILPRITGNNSIHTDTPGHTAFEVNMNTTEPNGNANVSSSATSIHMKNKESTTSLHATLPIVSDELMMVLIAGNHTGGIPADFTVRSAKAGASLYENQLYTGISSVLMDYFFVPKGNPTLVADVMTRAIGTAESDQKLSMFTLQPIPSTWLDLSIQSDSQKELSLKQAQGGQMGYGITIDAPALVTLNTAQSPYWAIRKVAPQGLSHVRSAFLMGKRVQAEKTVVNGWEQGFILNEPGTYVIIFWPNYLIYAGYLLTGGTLLGLGIYTLMKKLSVDKA